MRGIKPNGHLAPNARRILKVRIAEAYSYEWAITDPERVRELHDMRIACKRLRYLLEIFDVAFREDLEPFVEVVKDLQDVLGDIHDCDVQIPMLREHLDWLEEQEARAALALAAAPRLTARPRSAKAIEDALGTFRASLDQTARGDERIGIHALIARRERERREQYERFLDMWRTLKTERFRQRLESVVGIR